MKTFAIVNIEEITSFLYNSRIDGNIIIDDIMLKKIRQYRNQYGCEE
jgi:hypothetical protein